MSSLTSEYLEQIKTLGDISSEVKNLMVDLLIYEKKIEDGSGRHDYKIQLNKIIDKATAERLKDEDKNKTA